MIFLAMVLIAQCALALSYRILLLSGKIQEQHKPSKKCKGQKIGVSKKEACHFLEGEGFHKREDRNGEGKTVIFYTKRLKGSRITETAIYCALIFTLLAGLLTHAFGIKGDLEIGVTEGWIDLEKAGLKRGGLARIIPSSLLVRLTEKTPGKPDKPSSIVFEAKNRGEDEVTQRYWFEPGDSSMFDMFRIQYMGDYFMIFPTVFRKRHDYRAVPVKLEMTDAPQGVYSGDLQLREYGTRGTVEYKPNEKRYRIRIYRDEKLEADTVFIQHAEGKDGDFTVRVPSLGHIAVIRISRYNYRLQVLAGTAVFSLFIITRMIFRPQRVWLWNEKGPPLFYSDRGKTRKILERL